MKYRSRFDRHRRLLERTRRFLKNLNAFSDRKVAEGSERSDTAEVFYRQAKRIIADIEREETNRGWFVPGKLNNKITPRRRVKDKKTPQARHRGRKLGGKLPTGAKILVEDPLVKSH